MRIERSLRILVVDDLRDSTDSLVMLLKIWGHDAEASYGGASALATALLFLPQVVLLDIGMPGINGFQVAHRLHDQPGFADSVIIGITGFADQPSRALARAEGFDHYLLKPVEPEQLRQLLETISRSGGRPFRISRELCERDRERFCDDAAVERRLAVMTHGAGTLLEAPR
jgi:CheY-like chemotaxis protein